MSLLYAPIKTRTLFILVCSVALASIVSAEEAKKKRKSESKEEQAQTVHENRTVHTTSRDGRASGTATLSTHKITPHIVQPHERTIEPEGEGVGQEPKGHLMPTAVSGVTHEQLDEAYARSQGFRDAEQYRKWKETGQLEGLENHAVVGPPAAVGNRSVEKTKPIAPVNKPFHPQHFDLPEKSVAGFSPIKFDPKNHFEKSQSWQGQKYAVFRDYKPDWHDKDWWKWHYPRIIFIFGGWYYRNANYWSPAWGYDSNSIYAYDGPIYAYNDLSPDQVVANVQAGLKELGYYHGIINGWLDTLTRAAIADYQRDHGLYTTSAIDEPTLASLGMT
jgi:Putative peptidoglycan binding domain